MRKHRLEAKVRVIARTYLDGLAAPSETCLALSRYSFWLPDAFSSEEKKLLSGINSEADTLPVGKLAENWHPDFLAPKLAQLKMYDERVKTVVTELCQSLLEKLTKHDQAEDGEA